MSIGLLCEPIKDCPPDTACGVIPFCWGIILGVIILTILIAIIMLVLADYLIKINRGKE